MKFKFKKVKGMSSYLGWKHWEEGDYIVGKFVEATQDKFGNPAYTLEVIETSLNSKSSKEGVVSHDFKADERFTLNSNGSLNYKMEDVEVGNVVRVEYQGTETIEKKGHAFEGKEFHKVEVEIADDHQLDVDRIKAAEARAKTESVEEDIL